MVEAALLVSEQPAEWGRAVPFIGRAIRLEVVDADVRPRMHVPARLRPERFDVAVVALRLAAEQLVSSLRRLCEGNVLERRFRCRQRQLVKMKSRQLRS